MTHRHNLTLETARNQGLCHCLKCGVVLEDVLEADNCSRCRAALYSRKPRSLQKTWVYLITAILLFFPANLLPITYTNSLGQPTQVDTILSSILFLWHHGSYVVAAIIFLASIVTPFFKIAVLLYLLTHQSPRKAPVLQTKLYKFIHFVGRWSMIDVFVVALLGALVQGNFATITPGTGIFAFAAVVMLTMFATEHFDTRLLWDNYREHLCKKQK
ncbi:paraquat-inducible protein A [Suttonella sp. R2A3]|uniref:paraquat-inducible protein A n=1 Tax=Suttonella sp. R2A3 TaxID=2908648 RepID=UPI001F3B42D3|nr:paraquat-inducible protein A [Suttonella sp. R2A3]UJF25366.1 paraquat-inducible protein A [Suttonella sp. R2A3]